MSRRHSDMVSKSCGLRPRLADDRQERPEQRQPVDRHAGQQILETGEVRLRRQLEHVQGAAALRAHRLRAEHAGEPGPEPLEIL